MKARKLPSGSWRVLVYTHTDADGKQHRESFTAKTKAEAEMMAAQFKNNVDRSRAQDITVGEAVSAYIQSNEKVLSPSTIYGYTKDAKRFEPISHLKIRKLTSKDLQLFVSGLVSDGLSPKTVRNTWGLLRSSLTFSGVDKDFMIHLPSVQRKAQNAPSEREIMAVFESSKLKMKRAIMLGCHSLRRGEIAALKYADLNGNVLLVHSDMVKSADGKTWVHKSTPKTSSSYREVFLSDQELELLGTGRPEQYIVDLVPSSIGTNFYNACKKNGITMRFHDLRGYYASIAVALGVPDIYTSMLGGWKKNSSVLKEHYQKPIVDIKEGYANRLNEHLDNLFSSHDSAHETAHGN
jgi:integrase